MLEGEALSLRRFGSVTVPGLKGGRRYLVNVDLAGTTGLRPLLELWATAVDLENRTINNEVGGLLLAALADGTLRDGDGVVPEDVHELWQIADYEAEARRHRTEQLRAEENAALVESRILAQ